MDNGHHQGYGSSSLWGLYNTYTSYNLYDGADDCSFHSSFTCITFPLGILPVKHTKWIKSLPWHMLREMNPSLLTCIWSSEEEMSGYEETGNPSADMSHPPEWHSLCLCNLCPFPGHRMLWHWHLCPHLSQSLAKEKRHRNCNDECKHEKEGIGKFAKERDVETKRQAGGEGEKEGDINPQKNVSCLT